VSGMTDKGVVPGATDTSFVILGLDPRIQKARRLRISGGCL